MEKIEEIWKIIEDYPEYMISNMGNIKRLGNDKSKKEKILKQNMVTGYYYVYLYKEGKIKAFRVHRLVAKAFIPNPDNYPCVNHKDEDKTNNCISNLEWCDIAYNNSYGTRNDRIANAHKGMKHTQETKEKLSIALKGIKQSQEHIEKRAKAISKPVYQLSKSGFIIKKWDSARQVERDLKINRGNITNCLKGKRKTCGGFKWMYAKEYYNARTLNRMRDIFTKLSELRQVS